MTVSELDVVLTRRFAECTKRKRLPSDFADRLVRSIRRKRMILYSSIFAISLVSVIFSVCFVATADKKKFSVCQYASLTVSDAPAKESEVTKWLFLGFFRECLRRISTSRKKEEEEFKNQ